MFSVSRIEAGSNARPRTSSSTRGDSFSQRFQHYVARSFLQLGPILFGLCTCGVLIVAWAERDEGHLVAESGTGYWLGIAGSIIMLMLLAYPLRKRFRILHGIGRVASWFRFHMIMGIVGPVLIILHTNFKLGSLNSRLALFTMLVVVASGIVGRYLYAKIHKGLYGKQIELRDVVADLAAINKNLSELLGEQGGLRADLEQYALRASNAPSSIFGSFFAALGAGLSARSAYRRCRREIRSDLGARTDQRWATRRQRRRQMKDIEARLRTFFVVAKRAQRLAFFERLFGMWHHLHMPLFILLISAVVIHVVAVHRY